MSSDQPTGMDRRVKIGCLAVFVGLPLLVGGCTWLAGIDTSDSGAPVVRQQTDRQRYVEFVREHVPGAADRTDTQLVDGGRELCSQLDDGVSPEQIAQRTALLGFDVEEMGYTMVAAVNSFCPEHQDVLS